jgi:hypothetical protein
VRRKERKKYTRTSAERKQLESIAQEQEHQQNSNGIRKERLTSRSWVSIVPIVLQSRANNLFYLSFFPDVAALAWTAQRALITRLGFRICGR